MPRRKPDFPDTEAPTQRSAATMRLYSGMLTAFDAMTDEQRLEALDLLNTYLELPRYAQRRLVASVSSASIRAALERRPRT